MNHSHSQAQAGAPSPRARVEFYFSFISLWSYIGSLPFQALVQRHDVEVIYKPMDLYQVFAATGGKPPKERAPARQVYRKVEMARWKRIRNIPLVDEPRYYPAQPSIGHRMLLAALAAGAPEAAIHTFVHKALKSVWADELNIEDPATLVRLADESGLPGAQLLAESGRADLLAQESELTSEALQRNVFGAPFFFFDGEPYWGQDRIDLMEAAIIARR